MCPARRQDVCGGTDVNGPGSSHLGPLKTLFGITLPCVYASDSTSAQTIPQHIGKPEFPDTGWDRIRDLFSRGWVLVLSVCNPSTQGCSIYHLNVCMINFPSLWQRHLGCDWNLILSWVGTYCWYLFWKSNSWPLTKYILYSGSVWRMTIL